MSIKTLTTAQKRNQDLASQLGLNPPAVVTDEQMKLAQFVQEINFGLPIIIITSDGRQTTPTVFALERFFLSVQTTGWLFRECRLRSLCSLSWLVPAAASTDLNYQM